MYAPNPGTASTRAADVTLTILPPPCRDHATCGCAAAVEVAVQVRAQQSVPVVVGRLDDRLDHQPRGVVHPDVDAAPVRLDACRERLDGVGIAGVAGHEDAVDGRVAVE